jgi:uncharacterized membrane protein HdeD (DUF308 family)
MQLPIGWRWYSWIIRGIVAIVFGAIAIFQPGITLQSLILVFGIYAVLDGVVAIAAGLMAPPPQSWYLVLAGILGIIAGAIAIAAPAVTALALLALIAAWSLVVGLAELVAAWRLRQVMPDDWGLAALSGIVSIAFGGYVLVSPSGGALALLFLIGVYAIFIGVMDLMVGWRLRSVHDTLATASS